MFVLILAFFASSAAAQVRVTLPLAGYFRPGRLMPVKVETELALDRPITLRAGGALPTVVTLHDRRSAIVPMLLLDGDAQRVTWAIGNGAEHASDLPLTAVPNGERLLLATAGNDFAARFADQRVIVVQPGDDSAEIAAAIAVGWNALDAMAINRPASGSASSLNLFDPRLLLRLCLGGAKVASDDKHSIAQPVLGPIAALADEDAYAPTFSWRIGVSNRVRRAAALAAILVILALLACVALIRSRRIALAGAVVVIAIASSAIAAWQRTISPIWEAQGDVVVVDRAAKSTQIDSLRFLAARGATPFRLALPEASLPIFADEAQARRCDARLEFDAASGALFLCGNLAAGEKIAVLTRRLAIGADDPPINPSNDSPMQSLARNNYLARGAQIIGEGNVKWMDDQTVHWASVVIDRR